MCAECKIEKNYFGLKSFQETRSEVLVSILSNSPDLFRVDLEGVTVLMPAIVESLEAVLPTKDALRNDLRQSSIQLLLSMISLPFHFLVSFNEFICECDHPVGDFLYRVNVWGKFSTSQPNALSACLTFHVQELLYNVCTSVLIFYLSLRHNYIIILMLQVIRVTT